MELDPRGLGRLLQRAQRLGQRRLPGRSGGLHRFEGEEDAELGVLLEGEARLAGQLACGRGAGRLLGPVPLAQEEPTADEREHEKDADAREQQPQASVGPSLPGRLVGQVLLLGPAAGHRLVEERLLGRREVGRCARYPLLGGAEAAAPVELGVVAPRALPLGGRRGEVAEDPLALAVLVQPGAQPWPGPAEGLVGDLDALGVGGEEPAGEEGVDDVVVGVAVDQVGPADPVADRCAGVGERRPAGGRAPRALPPPVGGKAVE